MKIKLLVVGQTNMKFVEAGSSEFFARLKHYTDFEMLVIAPPKNAAKLVVAELKNKEAENILAKTLPSDFLILLDEKGGEYSSVEFASFLQKRMNSGVKNLVFVVGGAFGFSEKMYERANSKLSLSKMTFSHQLIRLIFAEQLYRAFTILRNEKYHNE
jgi:23S rRNA (pseudouridine1915-N3)-methyltransferase